MKRIHLLLGFGSLCALGAPAAAQAPPGEGPALGLNRITQAQITSGNMTQRDIRRKGLEIFSTPFNAFDGHGDGPFDTFDPDNTSPGKRPTLANNGTFMRVNGLDSQSCLECHSVLSSKSIPPTFAIGGVGGVAATAMPGPTEIDIDDEQNVGFASYNGRLINPPFVFGSGGVELVAKEMTVELQDLKLQALDDPGTVVPLITKGVDFGTISFDDVSGLFDESNIQGVDADLCVKPFGRKGNNASIRQFDIGALQFHQGMQPAEIVGDGVDADLDGVADEILVGELSALHIFSVGMERPRQDAQSASAQSGGVLFSAIGCADCHIPEIVTEGQLLPVAFPEVLTDPNANVFYSVDLVNSPSRFEPMGNGIVVEMFSDLKRHDMGPDLAEMTGDPLDAFFITPRLWGVADTAPYLHDGRALTLTDAIEAHDGDALYAAQGFSSLSSTQKVDLLNYLRTLRTPRNPNRGLLQDNLDTLGPLQNISPGQIASK